MAIAQYGIKIDSVSDGQVELLRQFVSEEKRKRTERFRFWEDTKRCVIGGIMVSYAIHNSFQTDPFDLEFELLEHGKPSVKGHKEWQFNLSHSDNWVVCAVGKYPIGIDIEKMDTRNLGIARHYYTAYENERIQAFSDERDRMKEFYKLWTLKESYMKAIGLGLRKRMDSFEFHLEGEAEVLFEKEIDTENFSFSSMIPDEEYIMSLCYNSAEKVRKMKLLDGMMLEEMCNTFHQKVMGVWYDKDCS